MHRKSFAVKRQEQKKDRREICIKMQNKKT